MNLVTCSILSNLSPNMFTGHGEAVFCITVISLILTTCINSSSLTHICMYLMLKIMLLCITNYNSIIPLVSWETSLLLQTPPSAVASLQTHSDTPRRSPPQYLQLPLGNVRHVECGGADVAGLAGSVAVVSPHLDCVGGAGQEVLHQEGGGHGLGEEHLLSCGGDGGWCREG